ncbi:MAG: cytochrome c oxidase subunit II [Actinomycetota bacterium]
MGAALTAPTLLAAPAAASAVSPEPAHSPNAEDITTLYWISLAVVVALITLVGIVLLLAVLSYRERRGSEPRQVRGTRSVQLRASAGLAILAIAMFVVSVIYTERAREVSPSGAQGLQASSAVYAQKSLKPLPADGEPLRIKATAQQWLWRYEYPNGAFSYYKLVVPIDTAVVLDLVSTDVTHGWYVPALGGKFEAVPGKLNSAWFRADETGTYEGRSSTFSGSAYAAERMAVEAVSPEEYQAFVEQQKRDIQEAQDSVAEQIASGATP